MVDGLNDGPLMVGVAMLLGAAARRVLEIVDSQGDHATGRGGVTDKTRARMNMMALGWAKRRHSPRPARRR
eukprot:496822-Prymnesium_polylepis.2